MEARFALARVLLEVAKGLAAAAIFAIAAAALKAEPPRAPVRDPDRVFQRRVASWKELRQRNLVMQKRDFSCGAAALATVVRYYWGDDATEKQFLDALDRMLTPEEAKDRVENGLALTDLRRVAVKSGYLATIGKLTFARLTESKAPVIVGISPEGYDHFAVYRGWDGYWVYLADPIRGNVRVPAAEFVRQWQKGAVLVVAKKGVKPPEASPLGVTAEEICVGRTTDELIRKTPLVPAAPLPRPWRP